jgi:hypothetical protein
VVDLPRAKLALFVRTKATRYHVFIYASLQHSIFFGTGNGCKAPEKIAALHRWKLQGGPTSRKNYNKA